MDLCNGLHFSSNPQIWDVIFCKYILKKYKLISIHFIFKILGLQDSQQSHTHLCLSNFISQDEPLHSLLMNLWFQPKWSLTASPHPSMLLVILWYYFFSIEYFIPFLPHASLKPMLALLRKDYLQLSARLSPVSPVTELLVTYHLAYPFGPCPRLPCIVSGVCVCVHMRERERKRERGKERERKRDHQLVCLPYTLVSSTAPSWVFHT